MRIELKRRTGSAVEFGIIYGSIAALALAAARFLPLLDFAPPCAFKQLAGFPCPTCGSTRSIVHLAHAEFFSAFALNPLICSAVVIGLLALLYCGAAFVFALPRISIAVSNHERAVVRLAAVLIVLFNWFYLIFAL